MAILSNTPTTRYITIQGMVITDNGVIYPISSYETCDKYIYWNKVTPFKLQSSNKLETVSDLYLIVLNKIGTPTLVNQTDIVVSFSENINNNSDINENITGIIEQVDENTTKIASLVKSVDGINITTGQLTDDLNKTNEKVTNLSQTSEGLSVEVSDLTKSYNDDKEFNLLKENIVLKMIDESTLLGELSSIMKEVSKDNSLDEDDKSKVMDKRSELSLEHERLIGYVDQLIASLHEQGLSENETRLTTAKNNYITSYDNINKIIDTTLTSTVIVPTQISTIINGISSVVTKLTTLKNICDDIIFLGTGGTLYEKIMKMNITADGIYSKISSIEENIKSNLSLEKGILNQHVEDLQTAVDRINTVIEEVYLDGLVNQDETNLVSQNLLAIKNEHQDLVNKYNEYLSNEYLSQEMKVKLQSIYSDYFNSYNSFVDELNIIISDGFFNESEKINIDLKLEDYRKNIIILHNNLSLAIDDYEKNRYESEIEAHKKLLEGQIGEVKKGLTDLNENIEGTFKNNVIDESERNAIKQNIKSLDVQKANTDSQFNQLYKNILLIDPLKTQFLGAYSNFNDSYGTLTSTLNEILNKETLITQQDKINMDKCYADLVLKTTSYTTIANQVIEFISNAEAEKSRESFQGEITDLQKQIDGIDLSIDGTFADNLLDKSERELIKSRLETINTSKVDVDSQYNKLYNSPDLKDNELKVEFKGKYDTFINEYNNFTLIVNTLLNKNELITQEEKKQLNDSISLINTLVGEFITCSMAVTENIYNNQTQDKILDINNDVLDLTNRMDNVITTVGDALTDGILDKAEKTSVEQGLLNLQAQKVEIDNEYTQLYEDVNLDTQQKLNLKTSYNTFILKYNTLVNSINIMLTKEDIITDIERSNYLVAYEDYKNYLATFTQSLHNASNQIYDKITENAKTELSDEISKVSQSVSDLSGLMNGAFYDGILSESEKISLKSNLNSLKVEKVDVDNQYNQTYNNSNLSSSNKANLKTSYDNYTTSYNALVNFIEGLINSVDNVNESHRTQLNTLLTDHNDKLALYVIQYNLAIENISKSYTDSTKKVLQDQIDGVNKSVTDLETDMNTVFQDSVLTEAEKLAIKERLQSIQVEKVNIDNQYNTLINNVDLVDEDVTITPKTNLKNAYDNLISSYTTLVNAINTLLNTDGILDESHKKPVDTAFTDYKNKLGVYSTRVNEAIDAISKKRIDDEAGYRKEQYSEINRTMEKISIAVGEVEKNVNSTSEKLSKIDQTVDGINTTVASHASELSTLGSTVNTQTSEISQLKDSIKLKVEATDITNAINGIQIGGRNLAQSTSNNYSSAYSNFTGVENRCPSLAKVLTDGLSAGDIVTVRLIYKYTNIVATSGQTASCWVQGSGDVTAWSSGKFVSSPHLTLTGSGEHEFLYSFKVTADHLKNSYWSTNIRHDYVQSGSVQWKMFKVEKGTKATDWTPAPEDIQSQIDDTNSSVKSLSTRVTTAESKLTKDSLTTTIGDHYTTSIDVDGIVTSKGYQTASQVQQTVDKQELKFTQSGGYNLLYNGNFKRGFNKWGMYGGSTNGYVIQNTLSCPATQIGALIVGEIGKTKFLYQKVLFDTAQPFTVSFWQYTSSTGERGTTNPYSNIQIEVTYTDGTISYHSAKAQYQTDIWEKLSVTITPAKRVEYVQVELWNRDTSKLVYYSNILLETGLLANDFSPNPNEIYDGITTIDKDGVTIAVQDGEGIQGYSNMSYEGITTYDSNGNTKSWFGANDTAYIKELNVDYINNPYIIQCRPRATNWYVGQSATGDGTGRNASNKANSIQSVLEYIKNTSGCYIYRQDINITCDDGISLSEDIYIGGWIGSGAITINFGSTSSYIGHIRVEECTPFVYLQGGGFWDVNNGCMWYRNDNGAHGSALTVRNANVYCSGFRVHSMVNYGYPFLFACYGATVSLYGMDLVKFWAICHCFLGASVYINMCRGDVGILAEKMENSTLVARANLPLFNTGKNINNFWNSTATYDGVGDSNSLWYPKDTSTSTPVEPAKSWHWVEKTFYFNLSSTTEGSGLATSSWTGKWGQGRWGSYKSHRGHAKPTESISDWCNVGSNTRNISMVLTMTRLNTSHGYGGAVPVPKIKQKDGTYWNSGVAFARGDTKSITLSSGVVAGLSDGTLTELTMWAGTSTNDYSQYNTVSLKVKCEKYY